MEDAHRRHKEVPFGWALWLSQVIVALQHQRFPCSPWCDPPPPAPIGDLHRLSAPH